MFSINVLMEGLLRNAEEFLVSGEENLKNKRFNASVSDFFKAIVILCDYLIYRELKIIPKNHNERFLLLRNYFKEIVKNHGSKTHGMFVHAILLMVFEHHSNSMNKNVWAYHSLKMSEI